MLRCPFDTDSDTDFDIDFNPDFETDFDADLDVYVDDPRESSHQESRACHGVLMILRWVAP